MASKNPQTVTVYGRLSFPVFDHKTAVERNAKSDYPQADPSKVAPEFNLIVDQAQLDKFLNHVKNEFFPFCRQQPDDGRNALTDADVKRLLKTIDAQDWEDQPPYIPVKPIHEKTAPLVPDGVASIKVSGNKGVDIELKAIVNSEDELEIPDPDRVIYPAIIPINKTVHTLYPGCLAVATLNLYAYHQGKTPGFSASAGVCVFKADADRFGGGIAVDEDEIFMD